MNDLEDLIARKKLEIDYKRRHLKDEWRTDKRNLNKSLTRDLSVLGGLALGYYLMPRKLGRIILKTWTVYTSIKQIAGFFGVSKPTPKRSAPRKARKTKRVRKKVTKA